MMKKKFFYLFLILLVTPLSLSSSSEARKKNPTSKGRAPLWTEEVWTGNEAPYTKIRLEIENLNNANQKLPAMIEETGDKAQKDVNNSLLGYRWAYLCYKAATLDLKEGESQLPLASRAISISVSPKVYEYSRLRFLINVRSFPSSQFRSLGERLVKRDPNDYDVKFYMLKLLTPGLSTEDKKLAVGYAQDLIRMWPNSTSAHSGLGGVYYRSWLVSKSKSDADNAIQAYEKYLQIAPPNHEFRKQAQSLIAKMRTTKNIQ